MYNEFRWALRRLGRRVGFSAVFTAILGTTLGITLTIVSVADATIGAALPYEREDALFALFEANPAQEIETIESSLPAVRDWIERGAAFGSVGAVRTRLNLALQTTDRVSRIEGAIVSRSMFETLGVRPVLGRGFTAEEDAEAATIPSVILSHHTWRNRFGADPALVGRTLVINGQAWTVVGVLAEGQTLAPQYAGAVDAWMPVGMAGEMDGPAVYTNRLYRIYSVIGRLRDGARDVELDRDLVTLTAGLAQDYPASHEGWEWRAEPLKDHVLAGVAAPIRALFLGGLLLFAVAVVNLLAFYVLRLRSERTEMATRLAVGARSIDLARLSMVELSLLGMLAGVVGVAAAAAALPLLPWWLPVDLPAHVRVSFRWVLALEGVAASIGSLVVVGAAGMAVALRGLERTAASGGRVVGESAAASRLSSASLAVQIAMGTFLAIGAATAVRSFTQLSHADPGVDPDRLVALRVDAPAELRTADELRTTVDGILRELEALPAVESAFLWSPHVPTEASWFTRVRLFDRPDIPDSESPTVRINTVGPGAVSALGLEIVAGRDLSGADDATGRRVILVSASAARTWWGTEEAAIGRMMKRWSHEEWSEVVGVVKDAPLSGRQGEGSGFHVDVYFLFGQDVQRNLVFLARGRSGTTLRAEDLDTAVRSASADLPAYDIQSMDERLARQDALARSSALLSSLFAAAAIVLAAIGLYGGLSFVVSRKVREIGLRQALGATRTRVVRELLRGGSVLVAAGSAAGVTLAWFGLRLVDSELLIAGTHDVPSYVFATSVLLLTSVGALLAPALRAIRRNPGESLREQ